MWYNCGMKRRQIFFLSVIVTIILSLAIVIQLLKGSNELAKWVFTFVNDWAPALSATAVVILIITFLWNLRENRRERARRAIYDWAKDAMKVTVSSQDKHDFLDILKNAGTLQYDADSLGKDFKDELMAAMDAITKYLEGLPRTESHDLKEEATKVFDSLGYLSEHLLND